MAQLRSAIRRSIRIAATGGLSVNCCIGNGYQPHQYRPRAQVDFYESTLRPFAMYRDEESMNARPDQDEMLGDWKEAFTGNVTNPDGVLEAEADFSKPRVIRQATKRRKT